MGDIDGKKTKVKIDLEYLWEKYGNRKKRKPKPEAEVPQYHHEGFSVKFKLSHAYKALEKQEQDVAEPVIQTKKPLTPKMIKHLAAKFKPIKPPEHEKPFYNKVHQDSFEDRVQADLSKYSKIGKLRREKTDTLLKIAKEKENEIPPSVQRKKIHVRCKPADFWTSLSMRKGTEKDDTLSHDSEYEDRTFLTNANLSGIIKSSKSVNTQSKSVKLKLDMCQSPKQANVQSKDDKPKVLVATKAVLEWDRRRKQRHEKKADQKCKIQEAAKLQQNHLQSKNKSQGNINNSHRISTKKKKRPKSALSPGRHDNTLESKSTPLFKTLKSKNVSQWSKCLDAMYLDVPDNFEEPELKKSEKETTTKSNDTDEEEVEEETEAPLQYKPSEYLYGMCNCQNIAKPTTLNKLQKKTKVRTGPIFTSTKGVLLS